MGENLESGEKAKKIEGIITALSESMPKLIGKVIDEFYSPEQAGKIGKGLAEYYKALRDGGIPEGCAVQMVQDYASNLSLKGMGHVCRHMNPWKMRMMMGPGMRGGWGMRHRKEGEEEEEPEEEETTV